MYTLHKQHIRGEKSFFHKIANYSLYCILPIFWHHFPFFNFSKIIMSALSYKNHVNFSHYRKWQKMTLKWFKMTLRRKMKDNISQRLVSKEKQTKCSQIFNFLHMIFSLQKSYLPSGFGNPWRYVNAKNQEYLSCKFTAPYRKMNKCIASM